MGIVEYCTGMTKTITIKLQWRIFAIETGAASNFKVFVRNCEHVLPFTGILYPKYMDWDQVSVGF